MHYITMMYYSDRLGMEKQPPTCPISPQLGKHMSRPYTHTFISLLTNCSGYIAVDRKFRARFRVNLIVMFVNERLSCLLTEAQCHSASGV